MENIKKSLSDVGLSIPEILLPDTSLDYRKFSVIACDQFSARPDYWQSVEEIVGDAPSALRITLPEVYLSDNADERIEKINATMKDYLANGVIKPIGEGFVYLRRTTQSGTRRGLVVALDLEQYDYSKGSKSLIRATEATVVDRLPPRIRIRSGATIELPHIMVLIDDREDKLMKLFDDRYQTLPKLYDFDLMMGGGHSEGYFVNTEADFAAIAEVLGQLKADSGDGFLYAMGDGNHSLAAAKGCWEQIKATLSEEEKAAHPARYALVELVNLHDPAMIFEPIHRLFYNVDPEKTKAELGIIDGEEVDLQLLQPKIDEWLKSHPEVELEYIHGAQECLDLAAQSPDRLAVIMPPFDRYAVYDVVRNHGAYVRKSFSIGEANEKRYYLECRVIK